LLSIAVFASGRGSNFRALAEAISKKNVNAKIVVVISNNSDAGALALAQAFHIPALHLSQKQFPSKDAFTQATLSALESHSADFIVLAGYMKKIDPAIIRRYRNNIINVHPALLPAFGGQGMYGHHVHEAVLESGAKFSGWIAAVTRRVAMNLGIQHRRELNKRARWACCRTYRAPASP